MDFRITDMYARVNAINKMSTGQTDITAFDSKSFIALGDFILSSDATTDAYINTLMLQVGKMVFKSRQYASSMNGLFYSDMQWGAVMTRLETELVEAEEDVSWVLEDGVSIDQYKVKKPKVYQKMFYTNNPWALRKTTYKVALKEAFKSEENYLAYENMLLTAVSNTVILSGENLAKMTLANYMAEIKDTSRNINLLAKYKEVNPASSLTAVTCLEDKEFLRYSVAYIKDVTKMMRSITTSFNDGIIPKFTPKDKQRAYFYSIYEDKINTVLMADTFNANYLELNENAYETIPYWQSPKTRDSIIIKRASDGVETTVSGILGVIYDVEACGSYFQDFETTTSPINARGRYYNTFWFKNDKYFNDLGDNFIVFTVSDETPAVLRSTAKQLKAEINEGVAVPFKQDTQEMTITKKVDGSSETVKASKNKKGV